MVIIQEDGNISLSMALAALRDMFAAYCDGAILSASVCRDLALGLGDLVRAAEALQVAEAERRELLAIAQDIDLVGRFEMREPVPAAVDNVVPFPRRARPCAAPTGGDAA